MTDSAAVQPIANDLLRVAVAAYLARHKGMSRYLAESDLQVFLRWRADRTIDPLAAQRVDVDLFVRWSYELFHHLPVRRPVPPVITFATAPPGRDAHLLTLISLRQHEG
jgi:hypothetical protein